MLLAEGAAGPDPPGIGCRTEAGDHRGMDVTRVSLRHRPVEHGICRLFPVHSGPLWDIKAHPRMGGGELVSLRGGQVPLGGSDKDTVSRMRLHGHASFCVLPAFPSFSLPIPGLCCLSPARMSRSSACCYVMSAVLLSGSQGDSLVNSFWGPCWAPAPGPVQGADQAQRKAWSQAHELPWIHLPTVVSTAVGTLSPLVLYSSPLLSGDPSPTLPTSCLSTKFILPSSLPLHLLFLCLACPPHSPKLSPRSPPPGSLPSSQANLSDYCPCQFSMVGSARVRLFRLTICLQQTAVPGTWRCLIINDFD